MKKMPTKHELANLWPVQRPLVCRRRFAAASIANGSEFEFFHVGKGEEASNLGFGSGLISPLHTNLNRGGQIPKGEVFYVHGIGISANAGIAEADLENFGLCTARWTEQGETETLPLPYVSEMPSPFNKALEFSTGTGGNSDRNVRFTGRLFLSKDPLFIIKGGSGETDKGALIIKTHQAFTPSAECVLTARLLGTWYTKVRFNEGG